MLERRQLFVITVVGRSPGIVWAFKIVQLVWVPNSQFGYVNCVSEKKCKLEKLLGNNFEIIIEFKNKKKKISGSQDTTQDILFNSSQWS